MANPKDDDFTRESFTMRRMQNWQLWGLTIAAILIVIALLGYYA